MSLELGDAVAAEREARAASDRGFDRRQAVPLLAQSMLSQQKERTARRVATRRQGRRIGASILVARGYAQIALKNMDERRLPSRLPEDRAERGGAVAGQRAAVVGARRPRRCEGQDRPRDQRSAEIARGTAGEGRVIAHQGDAAGSLAVLDQMLTDQPGNMRALLDRAGLLIATASPTRRRPILMSC